MGPESQSTFENYFTLLYFNPETQIIIPGLWLTASEEHSAGNWIFYTLVNGINISAIRADLMILRLKAEPLSGLIYV